MLHGRVGTKQEPTSRANAAHRHNLRDLRRRQVNLQTGCDVETPVQFLFFWSEVLRRLRHRDHLRPIDSNRSTMDQHERRSVRDNVLQPVGAVAVWEGDEEAVVVFNRDDRGFIGSARAASDVTDDCGAGFLRSSGSHGERPHHFRKPAKDLLSRSLHVILFSGDALEVAHSTVMPS